MPLDKTAHAPLSTYRVQLHGRFNFADATALVPYLRQLGISDLYLPPIFAAVPGSRHGYDVTDYTEVNPELGGLAGFQRLAAAQRAAGGAIILDFVPNHMGIAGMINQWWRDVLEFGPASRFASFFDIQWNADVSRSHPQVLVPLLGDHYGRVLERGEIKLIHDLEFAIQYGDNTLPLRPDGYADVWGPLEQPAEKIPEANALLDLLAAFSRRPDNAPAGGTVPDPGREYADLKGRMQSLLAGSVALQRLLAERLALLNGRVGEPRSFDSLHRLLERQHYRLARWQAGTHEVNYRRFFAIDTLIGLHMESPEVFRETHAMVGRLLKAGEVSGLRIDHIDGLRQPEDYLRRVQLLERPDSSRPLYVLVEKILADGETLPAAWPVHGTTGYEFIAQLALVLVDRERQAGFDRVYREFTGETRDFRALAIAAKRMIVAEMFANAVNNLGAELGEILAEDRAWRDLTRHELTTAVTELMVYLPVYRTYRRRLDEASAADCAVVERASAEAIAANPRADPEPINFLASLLAGKYPRPDAPESYRRRLLGWVLTFQQYTGAIMAKSVEDTTFYNDNRFIALNEVGGNPGAFGGPIEDFHTANAARQASSPLSLLTTSTHDSKYSEDVRARLCAISEVGAEWADWIADWATHSARQVVALAGTPAPDPLDRYRFFQVLLGAWPLEESGVDDAFRERLKQHLRKVVDEAKRHTSILNRNEAYLAACDQFVDRMTRTEESAGFLAGFRPRAARIARLGMVNSLTQLVLKCTCPGVPDFYQGNEIWDFSLVDPDNRRPVDFELRQRLAASAATASYAELLEHWRDGRIKLRVTRDLLALRRAQPDLFQHGDYAAAKAEGTFADNLVVFLRRTATATMLVAVPRLAGGVGCPPVGGVWEDTRLPAPPPGRAWRDALTARLHSAPGPVPVRTAFAELPFAVLVLEGVPSS